MFRQETVVVAVQETVTCHKWLQSLKSGEDRFCPGSISVEDHHLSSDRSTFHYSPAVGSAGYQDHRFSTEMYLICTVQSQASV